MKRILAAGALVGLSAIGTKIKRTDTKQDTSSVERESGDIGQHVDCERLPDLVLVFAYDYYPGIPFRPVSRLPQDTVNALLGDQLDCIDPIVSDPTDYHGYVILMQPTPNAAGEYTFLLVDEETLELDQWYQFTTNVTVFADQLLLLQTGIDTANITKTTTTPSNQPTTHNVIVETATPTEANQSEQ